MTEDVTTPPDRAEAGTPGIPERAAASETPNALDRAAMFKALGEPTRLRIFDFLRSCCCPVAVEETGDVRPVIGPTVGEICCHVTGAERITSTISEHLKELRLAGLITAERRGKNMIYGVNRAAVAALAADLANTPPTDGGECCE